MHHPFLHPKQNKNVEQKPKYLVGRRRSLLFHKIRLVTTITDDDFFAWFGYAKAKSPVLSRKPQTIRKKCSKKGENWDNKSVLAVTNLYEIQINCLCRVARTKNQRCTHCASSISWYSCFVFRCTAGARPGFCETMAWSLTEIFAVAY